MADTQVKIKITSAVSIGGKIIRPGTSISVAEELAKNLLQRGRAELVTGESNDLSRMNKAELLSLAGDWEIEGADSMNKAELITAIQAADAE